MSPACPRACAKAAIRQKAGRISVAGMTREVTFQPATGAINEQIDEAYRRKCSKNPYLAPMIGESARAATVRVTPKD